MKRRLLTGLLLLTVLGAALSGWLVQSESGLRWVYRQAAPLLPGDLEVRQLSGSLAGRIVLQDVAFNHSAFSLRASRIDLQWNPWALLSLEIDVSSLEIQQLDVQLHPEPAAASPQTVAWELPTLDLPLDLQLQDFSIDRLRLTRGEQRYELAQIRLGTAVRGSRVNIDNLALQVVDLAPGATYPRDVEISLRGEIDARGDYPHSIDVNWQVHLPTGAVVDNSTRLSGDLQSTQLSQQSSGALQANLELRLQNPLTNLQWQATLDLTGFDTTRLDATWPAAHGALQLSAAGNLHGAKLTGQLDADSSELGKLNARFDLRNLDQPHLLDGLHIDALELDIYEGKLAAQGQLFWSPTLRWEGQLVASDINPAALLPDWPGKLNARLESTGQIENGVLEVSARIEEASGRLRDYPFSLQGNLHWSDDRLDFDALELGVFDGKLVTRGQLFLSPILRWEGQLVASDINPAGLLPEWPGKLNARLTSAGQIENGVLEVSARIEEASGRLRDYPFSLQSNLHWRNDSLEVEFARLTSGNTQVAAQGRAGKLLDFEWTLDSPDLAELYPSASGQLTASGHLGGEATAPIVKARFKGQSLALAAYSAASIDGEIAVDLLNWQQLDIHLAASQLQIQGQLLQSLEIDGNQHQINASLLTPQVKAKLKLAGALVDHGWNGKLVTATIDTTDFANWSLQAPVAIELGQDALSLESMCLQSTLKANACAELRQRGESWQIVLELSRIPLRLLKPWTPRELELDGVIDARANLELDADGRLLGTLDASLPAAGARYPLQEGRAERFDYRQGELGLLLGPQQATAHARLILENGDQLEGSAVLPKADILNFDYERQAIEASIKVNAENWAVVDHLIPQVDKLSGKLKLDIDVTGSLAEPRLQGSASLRHGSFSLRASGQAIEQISLDLRSDGSDHARFTVDAVAAGGRFTIQGDTLLDRGSGWASNILLSGEGADIAALLNPWIEQPLLIDGRLQVDASLQFRAPDHLLGEISLTSAQGNLTYPLLEQDTDRSSYRDATLSLSLNEQGIVARSGFDLGKNNHMSAQISLPGARLLTLDPAQQAVSGKADFSLAELGLVQYLIPEVDQVQGQLVVAVTVGGKLANPELRATAAMQQASFNIPRLGLQIKQVSLQGSIEDNNHFIFTISARSGDGSLSIAGSSKLDPAAGWPSTIKITGENFEVAKIPEAHVTFSPDLTIIAAAQDIRIAGDLLVPFAKLQPRDISTAARVSRDTVVIGSEPLVEEGWQVSTRINVTLGERVTFFGFGFEGRLGGRLLVEDAPGKLSTGIGEITINEARYRAYGQRLEVDNGLLLYTGGTLDNPGLDVRAIRQINEVTVGLLIRGRLQQPIIELFSIPAMDQTDMLSYLLLGHPMDSATGTEGEMMAKAALALGLAGGDSIARQLGDQFGLDEARVESNNEGDQASLVVGRYLSPDLYVSYGVGLIESINTLKLRYRLAERWHVQAESGEYQGADLLFTIER